MCDVLSLLSLMTLFDWAALHSWEAVGGQDSPSPSHCGPLLSQIPFLQRLHHKLYPNRPVALPSPTWHFSRQLNLQKVDVKRRGGLVKPSPLRGGNKKTWRLLRGFPRKFLVHTVCAQVSRVAVWRRRQQAGGGGRGGKKQGFNSSTNQSGFMLCPQLQTSQQRMSGKWKTSYLNLDSMSVITINWQLLKQSISFRTGKVS